MIIRSVLILCTALIACSCQSTKQQEIVDMPQDPHSFAKPDVARVTHLDWTAKVDFGTKTISAQASWKIETADNAREIVLDTKGLSIKNISMNDGQSTSYKIIQKDSLLGEALSISINADTKVINIDYETNPDAEALQWLTPQQTAGKKFPFLFTQSQAILARSWVPCQDSPSIRFTYNADVTVPADLLALMSASNPQEKNRTGKYHFEMKQPIPSYLLALAVGDIAFQPVSNRSGVYAEPTIIEKAAWEFSDLEKMIAGAEELYGKYQWDRYDVIVLPPSFPFGGMENPRLTFATPTILAGDRSLTSLIAHELAHSWSGNLVTNATWNDFWLNEGFTVYFEHRIMEKLYGKDYSEMQATLAMQDLEETIQTFNNDNLAEDTKLQLKLEGRNPDEGVSDIAYNKGYFFLRSIEERYGRDKFDSFLNNYFTQNAFKAMNTDGFIAYIKDYYKAKFQITLPDSLFTDWIFSTGLPQETNRPVSTKFKKVDQTLTQWASNNTLDTTLTTNWSTHEWLHFLKNLPEKLTYEQMQTLDEAANLTSSGNAEIITVWLMHAVRNKYSPAYEKLEQFLINTGRRKFLSPLYNELVKTAEGRELATTIYKQARPNYHFVATNTFDRLLNIK